jgi:hypothetical protein
MNYKYETHLSLLQLISEQQGVSTLWQEIGLVLNPWVRRRVSVAPEPILILALPKGVDAQGGADGQRNGRHGTVAV